MLLAAAAAADRRQQADGRISEEGEEGDEDEVSVWWVGVGLSDVL